ncbi:MAG: hypothetical protein ABW217_06220, partial [Polyangiaceae bacterium]
PALCLVRCAQDRCDDGFSCRDAVCLPDAVAALTSNDEPEPGNAADAGAVPLPPLSLCASDSVVWRSLAIDDQRGYDALEGCERVDGDLSITLQDDADLQALRSLRVVTGVLQVVAGGVEQDPAPLRATLPGLENIEHVGGLLLRAPLSSLQTFARLRSIGPTSGSNLARGQLQLSTGTLRDLNGLALEEVDTIMAESEPLESLTGLGSARVRALYLTNSDITDMSGLEAVTGLADVALIGNAGLASLRGLPAESEITDFTADGNVSLTSLEGLAAPSEMSRITLSNCPISDFTALSTLTTVSDSLTILGAAVETLDALTNLRSASTLSLFDNPNLIHADALQDMLALSELEVSGNAALLRLPAIASVNQTLSVVIASNPLLASGPSFPAVTDGVTITLTDNPLLTRVDGFAGVEQLYGLVIARNASLNELDFGALTTVTSRLEVRGNAALPAAQVAPLRELQVASGEVYISAADAPSLLDPCPFLADGVCDETSGDCAVGTDFGDCPSAGAP